MRDSKMFGKGTKAKHEKEVFVDLFLDHEVAEKFNAYSVKNGIDDSKSLVEILERGMANYWLVEYKRLKEDCQKIEQLLNEYKKDNEALWKLERENDRLKKMLDNKLVPQERMSDPCRKAQEG